MRGIPLRMRTILLATGVFLLFGSLIVLASAWVVNSLKDQLVEVARQEVRQAVDVSRERIEQVLARYERDTGRPVASLAEVANDPNVRAEMSLISRNGAVLLTAVLDPSGATVLQTFGDQEALRLCPPAVGESISRILPPTGDGLTFRLQYREVPESVYTERLPVKSQTGSTVGFLEFGMQEERALARLDPISNHITRSLLLMVVLVVICFGLAVYLLGLASSRYLELQRRHTQSTHLASIGTMASGLAHEIRNPLHAMNLHLEATRDELESPGPETPEMARRAITNVQRQITSLNTILSNFMNFALPGKLEKEALRLGPVIGEVSNLLSLEFDARSITFHRNVPEDIWIHADPTAVRQVLTNVVLNAAQAVENSDKREVTLAARNEGGRCVITVEDTGTGLPEGKEEAIFDVFVSTRRGGSGFGLPIARRIMEEHNGSITAHNRREGGARFTIVFQAIEAPKDYQAMGHAAVAG